MVVPVRLTAADYAARREKADRRDCGGPRPAGLAGVRPAFDRDPQIHIGCARGPKPARASLTLGQRRK